MRTFILTIFIIFLLCGLSNPPATLFENLKQNTPLLKTRNFNGKELNKISTKNLPLIDTLTFSKIFTETGLVYDTSYILGHFEITKNRLGLICYSKTYECDHRIAFISLHIIDNRDSLVYINFITSTELDNPIYYETRGQLSKDFKILTTTSIYSSEWVLGTDSKTDTLFTDICKLNLFGNKIDTFFKKTTFKPMSN